MMPRAGDTGSRPTLLITNAVIINERQRFNGWLAACGDTIAALGPGDAPQWASEAVETVDACGSLLLPGVIDTHVHFREPGLTHKADIATESRAAVAGGVTTYIDMPNTRPATTTMEAVEAKLDRAARVSAANFGFFIGATNDNLDELLRADYKRCAGVKLFLGSSTGNMLVDNPDTLDTLFRSVPALIAVHAEHEASIADNRERLLAETGGDIPIWRHPEVRDRRACLASTRAAVELARTTGARLHLLHISTADELELLDRGPLESKRITAETCPQYLTFAGPEDYRRLGAMIKCNPAVKEPSDRAALRHAVATGLIDTIATDHAPHLEAEKAGNALTAVSGIPMVQFSLPLMLTLASRDGIMSQERVVEAMCHNPATLLRIGRRGFLRPGYKADLVLASHRPHTVNRADIISRCGWSPLEGMTLDWEVTRTWVNGRRAWDTSTGHSPSPAGEALVFNV